MSLRKPGIDKPRIGGYQNHMPTPPVQDDAADKLAKEIITRFCDSANLFMKDRVRVPFIQNPMQGLRLPFAPLAEKIREYAKTFGGPPEPVVAPVSSEDVMAAWFNEEPKGEPQKEVDAPPSLTLSELLASLGDKKLRLKELAERVNYSQDEVLTVINSADSGLTISGPAKWVAKG